MIKKIVKEIVFRGLYPCYYRLVARGPIHEKKVIFVENHLDTLSDNYSLLYEELKKREYEIHVHYLRVADSKWKDIIRLTLHLLKDMSNAKCVFLNESNSVFGVIPLRKETKLVQLWHACGAFKKWGFSVAEQTFGENRKTLERYSGHRNYSLVPVSGQEVCWAYADAFGLEDDGTVIKPLGVSRTDVFFDLEKVKAAKKHLYKIKDSFKGKKIVLYAPTFRGEIKEARTPDFFDYRMFLNELGEEYKIIVKQHPFVKKKVEIPKECEDSCIEIKNEMTIEELLMVADLCVTDYSSVVFEYALMKHPIFFLSPDLEDYYDERGFYYSYRDFVPGPIVNETKELINEIKNISDFNSEQMDTFCKRYMSGCDGNSTNRILEEIFDKKGETYGSK